MEGEILTPEAPEAPVEGQKKSKTWLIILIVVVLLGLCCCILPAILWFAGDGIIGMFGIDPNSFWQEIGAISGSLLI
jgi:flagellar basal body-associated protein FliL